MAERAPKFPWSSVTPPRHRPEMRVTSAPVPEVRIPHRSVPNARAALRDLAPGRLVAAWSDGDYSLADLIEAAAEHAGPSDLHMSTWRVARDDADQLAAMRDDGRLRSIQILTDRSAAALTNSKSAAAKAAARTWSQVLAIIGEHSIRIASIHAKTVALTGGDLDVTLTSSANLNRNPRAEFVIAVADPDLAAFFRDPVADAFRDEFSESERRYTRGDTHRLALARTRQVLGSDLHDLAADEWTRDKVDLVGKADRSHRPETDLIGP